jgi:O-antigen ligase
MIRNTTAIQQKNGADFVWLGLSGALFMGILASKFLISLSLIFFLLAGVATRFLLPKWADAAAFFADKVYISVMAIFLLLVLGAAWQAGEWSELSLRLRIGLPFLVLPLAWAWQARISREVIVLILQFFVLLMLGFALWVLGYYFWHYAEMQLLLQRSGAVPVPSGDHIRFSLLLVLAVGVSFWLSAQLGAWKIFWRALAVFFIVSLHILSVRSGLLALYLSALVFLARYIILYRRYVLGAAGLAMLFLLPLMAYWYVPSFRTKIQLTIHNIQLAQTEQIGDYSDTQRMLSYRIAWRVWKENPILGTGLGNLRPRIEAIYEAEYPQQKFMFPHNQFLTYLAAMGVVGLLAFLLLALFPFFYRRAYREPLVLLFYVVMFSSFLTENTLLISIGTTIYVYFLLLFVSLARRNMKYEI